MAFYLGQSHNMSVSTTSDFISLINELSNEADADKVINDILQQLPENKDKRSTLLNPEPPTESPITLLGKKIANNSKTSFYKIIGQALQKAVFEVLGNTEMANKLEKERGSHLPDNFNLFFHMAFDSDLANYWFQQVKLFGEIEGKRMAELESERLLNAPDYNVCKATLAIYQSPTVQTL